MNYYEDQILEALRGADNDIRVAEDGASGIISKMSDRYPTCGSKIDWRRLVGVVEDRAWRLDLHSRQFQQFFHAVVSKFELPGEPIYLGDGLTDFSLHAPIRKFTELLRAIFEVPHHHYFVGQGLDWCMCFTMEGDMNFAFLRSHETMAS